MLGSDIMCRDGLVQSLLGFFIGCSKELSSYVKWYARADQYNRVHVQLMREKYLWLLYKSVWHICYRVDTKSQYDVSGTVLQEHSHKTIRLIVLISLVLGSFGHNQVNCLWCYGPILLKCWAISIKRVLLSHAYWHLT